MNDRRFTDIDLRRMLEGASGYREDVVEGRCEGMKNSYLEVTFRHGRPLAAYLYLPRQPTDKSYRTERADPGLVIDFNRSGRAGSPSPSA